MRGPQGRASSPPPAVSRRPEGLRVVVEFKVRENYKKGREYFARK